MEILKLDDLAPNTEIGQARARLRVKAADQVALRDQVSHLASELQQCESWLASATWGKTDLAKYAERTAERELLQKALTAEQLRLRAAEAAAEAGRAALGTLTRRYVDRCEELRRATAATANRSPAEIAQLEAVIAGMMADAT